jgi:competence protein ComEA
MLNIRSRATGGTAAKQIKTSSPAQPATDGGSEAGAGITITRDSGGVIVNESAGVKSSKVNINTANVSELDTLPGIGEATAADIIQYREKHGPFKRIEDIMKVTGIKENKYNKIKDVITI